MKVRLYPSDDTGCGRVRMKLPGAAAQHAGATVEFGVHGKPGDRLELEYSRKDPRYARPAPIDADVVVFQRVAASAVVTMIPLIQARGIAVVVDLDDDMSALPPQHPSVKQLSPRRDPDLNWLWMGEAAKVADLVTVTSPALADRYGKHGRVAILPNLVPASVLDLPRSSDGNTVGWSGWTISHPGDLRVCGNGISEALRDTGARFLQVGPGDDVRRQLALDDEPEATGALWDIGDYFTALTRLDVALAPLMDSRFNHAKSWLRPLEQTAAGATVVMSDRAEYGRLHAQGIGLTADDRGRSWRRQVRGLLEDPERRREIADHGRRVIRERYTYESNGHLWCEAWQQALENRRAGHALEGDR